MCVENERESKGETICEGDTHKHTQTYIGRECVQKRERELVSVLLSDVIGTSMTERERERERERMCFKPMLLVCTTYLLPRQVKSKLVLKPRSSWLEQEQKFFLVLFDLHRLSGSIRDDAAAVDVDAIPSLLSR